MAWDTEATRRALQEAATAEFAERGRDGTTMARIAERAGINKERLYNYFGDKQTLFDVVLAAELERLSRSVARPSGGLERIGEFAGRTFDHYAEHPELARLLLWEGLANGPIADEAQRTTHYRNKVQQYRDAQRAGALGDDIDADHLVFLVIALAAWWFSVPQLASMITGSDGSGDDERARRRASVVASAERLALSRPQHS